MISVSQNYRGVFHMLKAKLLLMVLFFATNFSSAEGISISELGDLKLSFSKIEKSDSYKGSPLKAIVTTKPNESYLVISPFNPQLIELLVENGKKVTEGTKIMKLSGSEVHHFLEMLASHKSLFELSQQRYKNNLKLYQNKSINSEKWFAIVKQYNDAKIEYGHLKHFAEMIEVTGEDSVILKAPISGILMQVQANDLSEAEKLLVKIIPNQALRLKIKASNSQAEELHSVSYKECKLQISEVENISSGMFVNLWSENILPNCQLYPGQSLSVTPHYQSTSYIIPKSSVYVQDRETSIFIKQGNELLSVKVSIISSELDNYFVTSETQLSQKQVLTTSVSAVNGIQLGFGGD